MSKMHNGASKFLFERAKALRVSATSAEMILWDYLKTKPLGCKFRRQHPYGNYIFDFYCHSLKLVIEVDGSIHDQPSIIKADAFRQQMIEQDKMNVLRFRNNEVERELAKVISCIEEYIVHQHQQKEFKSINEEPCSPSGAGEEQGL